MSRLTGAANHPQQLFGLLVCWTLDVSALCSVARPAASVTALSLPGFKSIRLACKFRCHTCLLASNSHFGKLIVPWPHWIPMTTSRLCYTRHVRHLVAPWCSNHQIVSTLIGGAWLSARVAVAENGQAKIFHKRRNHDKESELRHVWAECRKDVAQLNLRPSLALTWWCVDV